MNVNAASFYSVGNGEKAAAAAVRKKLLTGAGNVEEAATSEETLMIGRWLDPRQSQTKGDAEDHSGPSGKDTDFG
jgi:hypothetical protein